jgi:hypothetical protein
MVSPTPTAQPKSETAFASPPASNAQYQLVLIHRLTPCENRGKHNVFIQVVDGNGNPVDGVHLVQVPHSQIGNVLDHQITGTKGPGKAEFVMWKLVEYDIYVTEDGTNPANTDIAQQVHSNFTDEAECASGEGGNTLFHNSFNLVFRKSF